VMNAEMVGGHMQAEQLEEDFPWAQNKLFDNREILATVQDLQCKNMLQVTGNEVKKVAG